MPEYDKWSRWLLETRFGGDEKIAASSLRLLRQKSATRYSIKRRLRTGKCCLTLVPATD